MAITCAPVPSQKFVSLCRAVGDFAAKGRPVIGICTGFNILGEVSLLPGALLRNVGMKYVCKFLDIRTETQNTPFTKQRITDKQRLQYPD